MRKFGRIAVFLFLLLATSLVMTGCDASKIMDVISKVATGITEAIPKIKEVIGAVTNALPANTVASNTANVNTNETAANNANVTITNPGDNEEVTNANPATNANPPAAAAAAATGTSVIIRSQAVIIWFASISMVQRKSREEPVLPYLRPQE